MPGAPGSPRPTSKRARGGGGDDPGRRSAGWEAWSPVQGARGGCGAGSGRLLPADPPQLPRGCSSSPTGLGESPRGVGTPAPTRASGRCGLKQRLRDSLEHRDPLGNTRPDERSEAGQASRRPSAPTRDTASRSRRARGSGTPGPGGAAAAGTGWRASRPPSPPPPPAPAQRRTPARRDDRGGRHSPAAAPGGASGTAHCAVRPPARQAAGEGQRSGRRGTARRGSLRGTCHRAPRPPFRLLRTCSLSGGRRGSSPARWGSPPADPRREGGRKGGRAPVLSGWGCVPPPSPPPRRGRFCLNSASAAPPPALRRGPGARPDGGGGGCRRGMRPRPGAHPVPTPTLTHPSTPRLQDPSSRGRWAHTGDPIPVKSLELGCVAGEELTAGRPGVVWGGVLPPKLWVPSRCGSEASAGWCTVGPSDS